MTSFRKNLFCFAAFLLALSQARSLEFEELTTEESESPNRAEYGARIPAGYHYYNGTGYKAYYRFYTVPLNWHEAVQACEREGAELVVLNSKEEADLVLKLINSRVDYAFVGAHDLIQQGRYITVLDETLHEAGYAEWAVGQPSATTKHCVVISAVTGKLYASVCNTNRNFVCEFDL